MVLTETLTGFSYVIYFCFLIVGIFFLIKGADYFVESASGIAKRFKIPEIIIGLTVVSFGTSVPELAVSVASNLKGESGLALGNVVGSNIANLSLVLGVSALVHSITVQKRLKKVEFPFLIISSIIFVIFSLDNFLGGAGNMISRGEALIFVGGIILFCWLTIFLSKKDKPQMEKEKESNLSIKRTIFLLIVGLIGIIAGAEFVTGSASKIALSVGIALGVDKGSMTNLVGLTVVAVGTSLPELVTSAVAAKKGKNEMALGNVVGSNIFNILFICGISGLISPLVLSNDIIMDSIIMLGLTFLVYYFCHKRELSRGVGILLISFYICYLIYTIIRLFYPALIPGF